MSVDMEHENEHVIDLLPAYINQTLSAEEHRRVNAHMDMCTRCSAELVLWQGIAQATIHWASATSPQTQPSLAFMARVRNEVQEAEDRSIVAAFKRKIMRIRQLMRVQALLLPRGSWIALPFAIISGFLVLYLLSGGVYFSSLLGFVAPLITAASVGFIYNPENDPGLEVTLSTPTSLRLVLVCRLLLVCGYNLCLALLVTLGLVVFDGANFSLLLSLWMGPLLLLTGLSLLLSFTISSPGGICSAVVLWSLRFVNDIFPIDKGPVTMALGAFNTIWQTNPTVLLCAALLFILAVYAVPRQVRWRGWP